MESDLISVLMSFLVGLRRCSFTTFAQSYPAGLLIVLLIGFMSLTQIAIEKNGLPIWSSVTKSFGL